MKYVNNYENIKNNLFNWNHCIEEIPLQIICINLSHDFYDIGTGSNYLGTGSDYTYKNLNNLPNDKFLYKTIRTD
jgi:hypothetical protein